MLPLTAVPIRMKETIMQQTFRIIKVFFEHEYPPHILSLEKNMKNNNASNLTTFWSLDVDGSIRAENSFQKPIQYAFLKQKKKILCHITNIYPFHGKWVLVCFKTYTINRKHNQRLLCLMFVMSTGFVCLGIVCRLWGLAVIVPYPSISKYQLYQS